MANVKGLVADESFSAKLTVAMRDATRRGAELHGEGRAAAGCHRACRLAGDGEVRGVGSDDRDRAHRQGRGTAVGNRVGFADRIAERGAAKCRVVGGAGRARPIGDRFAVARHGDMGAVPTPPMAKVKGLVVDESLSAKLTVAGQCRPWSD